jgi:hypothetical protein
MNGGRRTLAIVTTAAAVAVGIASAAEAPQTLSATRILTQVVGNTIVFQDDSKDRVEEYLAPDGSVHGKSRVHGSYTSEWQIRFGHYLCLVSADPLQSGCVQVKIEPGAKVEFLLDVGETEGPFALVAGNPGKL